MNTLYSYTQIGFIATTFVFYGLLLSQLKKALNKTSFSIAKCKRILGLTILSLTAWLTFTGFLAYTGFFSDFTSMPPKFFIVLIVPLVTIIWISSTSTLREILEHVPPQNIMYLQSFRVSVEILLWMLLLDNLLPIQMTFEGRNFDILAGLSGPLMGWLYYKGKVGTSLVSIWNIAGLLLLLNIVTIALLSTPLPIRVFMNEPANTIVTNFPVVWLPALLVPLAYTLHIFSLKQMSMLRGREIKTPVAG